MGVGAIAGALARLPLARRAGDRRGGRRVRLRVRVHAEQPRGEGLVRLAGVLVLVLLSRISNYFREMRRQGEFVYKTGRWFEQLDREVRRARLASRRARAPPWARSCPPASPHAPPPTCPPRSRRAGAEAAHEDGQRRRLARRPKLSVRGGECAAAAGDAVAKVSSAGCGCGRRDAGRGGLGGEQVDERYGRVDRGAPRSRRTRRGPARTARPPARLPRPPSPPATRRPPARRLTRPPPRPPRVSQERLQGMGDQLSELQAEWFENSQPRRSEAYAAKLFETDDDSKRPPRPAAAAGRRSSSRSMTSGKAASPEPPLARCR